MSSTYVGCNKSVFKVTQQLDLQSFLDQMNDNDSINWTKGMLPREAQRMLFYSNAFVYGSLDWMLQKYLSEMQYAIIFVN